MPINYPDDVRQYDDDPRSPFYTGPDEADMKDAKVNAIINSPDITSEMDGLGGLEDQWSDISNAMRDLCYGNNVDEAVATLREKWLEACEAYADTKEYEELLGDYDDAD